MLTVKDILKKMYDQNQVAKDLVLQAWQFAEHAHEGQKRLSGEPFFSHPANTAFKLAEMGMDKETIVAGLLHDVLEDTQNTTEDLNKLFGQEITSLVEGVTRLGKIKFRKSKEKLHTESLRNLFIATAKNVRTIIIKLVDRLHNMQTLEYQDKERQYRKAWETLEIYSKVADRLGIGLLKKELEDLSYAVIEPEEYNKLQKIRDEKVNVTKQIIESVIQTIEKDINKDIGKDFFTEINIKGIYSLHRKLKRKDGDLERIHDIFTISVVVPKVEDCYKTLGIIHRRFKPLPKKIKDFIAFPKPNGYKGIETTVFYEHNKGTFEIQIFTEEMLLEAKYGIIFFLSTEYFNKIKKLSSSSDNYLFSAKNFIYSLFRVPLKTIEHNKPCSEIKIPSWISKMIESQKYIEDPHKFLQNLTNDFFNQRLYVFTLEGDVIDLPIDSCPIDFAYSLGTDIGNHLKSVKIDHETSSINTKLKNGNIVEIVTSTNSHPSKKWLDCVKTVNAKQAINNYFNNNLASN